MPRAIESPISRMLRFFKDSTQEVAQIGLDLASEVVREREAQAAMRPAAVAAASITPRGIPVPVARLVPRAAAKVVKAKAKGKPGRKPLPEGTLTRAQILQRARDAKKKKARAVLKAAAAAALLGKGKAKPAGQAKAKVPPPPGPTAKSKRRKAAPSTRVERRQNPDEGHLPADKLPAQRHPVDAEPELFDNGEDEMLDPIAGEIDPSLALDD